MSSVQLHPTISATDLGSYLVSSPLRRQTIIEKHKYAVGRAGYYDFARSSVIDFIMGRTDRAGLLKRAEEYVARSHVSAYARNRSHRCAEAILRFLDIVPLLDMQGMTPSDDVKHEAMDVVGVNINVDPDLILEGQDSHGRSTVGAIKLYISPAHPHTDASAQYVTSMLRRHARVRPVMVRADMCLLVDVFAGRVSYARAHWSHVHWLDVGSACYEIRQAWPTV